MGAMRARRLRMRKIRSLAIVICLLGWAGELLARQMGSSSAPAVHTTLPQQGIFLVFPFENSGASARLDWIGEGLEELTIQRLSAAGQQVYSHAGRLSEMDRYGLPSSAKLSRATMLRIGQEMDVDYIVFGDFTSDGQAITVNARLLRVSPVALLPVVEEHGPLSSLMELHTKIAWELLRNCNHGFPVGLSDLEELGRSAAGEGSLKA